jgi:hypothetical protein
MLFNTYITISLDFSFFGKRGEGNAVIFFSEVFISEML